MNKLLKFIGYIFAGLITLLVVTVLILKLIPDAKYNDWITSAAESATGRDVSIEALELDFGTALRVRADKFRMANADWSKQDDMLQVGRLEAEIGLLDLLSGKADIRAVVEDAEMLAEMNAEGISNWAMGTGEAKEDVEEADDDVDREFSGLPLQPIIREIRIDDFTLTQVAEPDATAKVAHLKQLLIETPEKDTTLSLSADLNGEPIELSANLGDMQQFLNKASEPVQLKGDIAGNILTMSGNWGPLFPEQALLIDIDLKIPGTAELAEFVGLTIEEFEPINITAKLIGDGDKLSMNPIVIDLSDPNAELKITGSIDNLKSMSGITMNTDANTESLEKLFKQLHLEVPSALPPVINLSAQVNGGLQDLAMSEMVLEAKDTGIDMKATASISDLLKLKEIEVKLDGTIDSLSSLSRYAQTELPETDPIKLNGTLKEDTPEHYNYSLHADTGTANVDITGTLDGLAVPEKLELSISIKAANLTDFNKLAQAELPDQGPLDMSAMLLVHNTDIALNDLKVSLKDQKANGNLALKLPEGEAQPTVLNGKLDISLLDLAFLVPQADEAPAESETPAPAAEPAPEDEETTDVEKTENVKSDPADTSDRLFSNEPILQDQLKQYEIDLAVNVGEIKFEKSELKDVQLVVKLKDGLLVVDPITGAGGAGKMDGVIRVDGQSEVPVMDVDINIVEVPMPNLGGKLDFDADLAGKGKSVAELMGSLNGNLLVVMRDGKIEGALVQKFGSGLLSFAKEKGYTELECGILRVTVKDGIANFDKRLAAQLTEVTWRGGGEVNLKTEEIGIGIAPKPRKGIPISISGELSSLIYVGGTLKNPKLQLNPKDVAVKYAKYSAYVASGGLTYLAEVIKDKIDANKDVCELILDGTVFEEMDKEDEKAEKKAQKEAEKAAKDKSE